MTDSEIGDAYQPPRVLVDRFPTHLAIPFISALQDMGFTTVGASIRGSVPEELRRGAIPTDADTAIAYGAKAQEEDFNLTEKDLDYYSRFEGNFLLMLSRFAVKPQAWAVNEMSTHFYEAVNWAEQHLTRTDPDVIFGYTMPHDPSSMSMYLASKRHRIPYIFVDGAVIANRGRFLACSYGHRMLLAHDPAARENLDLAQLVADFQEGIQQDFARNKTWDLAGILQAQAAFRSKIEPQDRSKLSRTRIVGAYRRLNRAWRLLTRRSYRRAWADEKFPFFKIRRGPWFNPRTRPGFGEILRMKLSQFWRLRSLEIQWTRLAKASKIEPVRPYALLALPSCPEASTIPGSRYHQDVELLLRQVLTALPLELDLVLRLHPVQFMRGNSWTTLIDWWEPDLFSRVAKLGGSRIRFASVDSDLESLIDRSSCLIVINGSMGFEALARGKPVLHTSQVWYEGAAGALLCQDSQDFRTAFQRVLSGWCPEPPALHFAHDSTFLTADIAGDLSVEDMSLLAKKMFLSLKRFQDLSSCKWEF